MKLGEGRKKDRVLKGEEKGKGKEKMELIKYKLRWRSGYDKVKNRPSFSLRSNHI